AGRAVLSMLNWMVRWYKPGQGDSAEAIAAGYFDLLVGGMRA
ncbi:TetR family transcriptional regulator, partial [Achromobacter xylosoxidans]